MSEDDVKYVLELHVPGAVKGETFAIMGLGEFKNGSTYEVTEAEANRFRDLNPTSEAIVDEETQAILGTEVKRGPTLLKWAKNSDLFTVTTVSSDDDEDEEDE